MGGPADTKDGAGASVPARTYPNVRGKQRTVAELREEYDTLARLQGQQALAYPEEHPAISATGQDLDRARDCLRRALATESGEDDPEHWVSPPRPEPPKRAARYCPHGLMEMSWVENPTFRHGGYWSFHCDDCEIEAVAKFGTKEALS